MSSSYISNFRKDWLTAPLEVRRELSLRTALLVDMLGGVLFFLFLNIGVYSYLLIFPQNLGYYIIQSKWELFEAMDEPVDWLILGDSTGNQGVIPSQLEARLGGRAINLCTIGHMALWDDSWFLERYIKRFGAPKNILLVHVYEIWERDNPKLLPYLAQVAPPWHGLFSELSMPLEFSWGERWQLLLHRYFPLYAQHKTLAKRIRQPELWFKRKYVVDDKGYLAWPDPEPEKVTKDMKGHLKIISRPARMSVDNRKALINILETAKQYDTKVYIVTGPVYEELAKEANFQRYFAEVVEFLNEMKVSYPQLQVVEELATFPREQMTRVDHIIHESAPSYTDFVVEEIRR